MEYLDQERVDNMQCGPFNNKSYYGYKSSVLKSGICKYYRREQFDKLEWCITEMFIFGIKNNGMMTNVINRLRILIMEEISFNEFGIIVDCISLINKIDEEKDIMEKLCLSISMVRLASKCKKGRICSYVNNWWKYNSKKKEQPTLKNILKFKKENDTTELLEYGELMIDYITSRNEKLFEVYTILFDMKDKMGRRYRRTDAVYLYWELIEKYYCYDQSNVSSLRILNSKKKILFDFAINMFNRKGMKERKAFGVWMGLFVVWDASGIPPSYPIPPVYISSILKDRIKINIDEPYVIKDFHVNKKFGLSAFGTTGAYVVNEDITCLGHESYTGINKMLKYREYYQIQKDRQENKVLYNTVPVFMSGKQIKGNSNIPCNSDTSLNFSVIKVIEEGVCGLKKCCIIVKNLHTGEKLVIKEMPKSMNYGIDYLFMDELKESLGLKNLNMFRISSKTNLEVIDKEIKSFVGNWKFKHTNDKDIYYCVMDYKDNIGDIGKHKHILDNNTIKEEMLKIRLFNGLFGTSDNILRNILVSSDNKTLYSIDENDIYGKRKNIFNKNDWCLKDKWCLDNMVRVWKELITHIDIELVKTKLITFGFEHKLGEFKNRLSYTLDDIITI